MSPDARLRMKISRGISLPPLVASGLLVLSLFSGGALAADAAAPQPHWSGLPIWGVEAEAQGYQIPYPFGIGINGYSARQPVNIHDLQLARNGPPVSVKNFLVINTVDTSQQNLSAKFDVLVFPFLDVYVLGGYTTGTTKGLIQIPEDPILGIIEPQIVQLNAKFSGPTYGARHDPPRRRQGQRLARPDGHRGGRLEPHPDEADIRKRNGDRRHEAGGVGLLGQGGPARHRRQLQWRGPLDRRDASEHPAGGRRPRCQYRPSVHRDPVAAKTVEHAARRPVRVRQGRLCPPRGRVGARKSILAAAVYRF